MTWDRTLSLVGARSAVSGKASLEHSILVLGHESQAARFRLYKYKTQMFPDD